MNCLYRANISAGTAVSAYIRIDFVNIAFRNCFYRTFVDACSASSAIFINYISHLNYF
jgi:hypothetical protein